MNSMDKIFVAALLLCLATALLEAQTVNSSCEAADQEVFQLWEKDAKKLAIRRLYQIQSPDSCQVIIPQIYVDSALQALLAVHNAKELGARKEVVELYEVHALAEPNLNSLLLLLDTSFQWAEALQLNDQSGLAAFDKLLRKYDLYKQEASLQATGELLIRLRSPLDLNMAALGNLFAEIEGVNGWLADSLLGESTKDISYQPADGYVELIYRYSWLDCETDCRNDHFWRFKVMDDCSVRFEEAYGQPLGIQQLEQLVQIRLFPNPSVDRVNVNLVGPPQESLEMQLFDAAGQLLEVQKVSSSNGVVEARLSLAGYPLGTYFVAFRNDKNTLTEKVLKR